MAVAEEQATPSLIAADEPAVFQIIHGGSDRRLIIACDHASGRIPRSLGTLGLADHYLEDHIAWDIGAAAVAQILHRRLGCVAVMANYSRLAVDLNRHLNDATVMPAISDGVLIPGNLSQSEAQRVQRIREMHTPYHEAMRREIASMSSADQRPVMITLHSFTPHQHGLSRPWDVGVLWDTDARLALPLMARLRSSEDVRVGDNEPYSGRHPADFTLDHHAERLGLAHAGVEIRQDLVTDQRGQAAWGDRLARALEAVLDDEDLYRPAFAGEGDRST